MSTSPYQPQAVELIVDTPDVRVAEITLAPRTSTPEHEHTAVPETCYCLAGELTSDTGDGRPVVLKAGDKTVFAAGASHQLRNDADVPCRFLLVHAVGRFDFVPAKPAGGGGGGR